MAPGRSVIRHWPTVWLTLALMMASAGEAWAEAQALPSSSSSSPSVRRRSNWRPWWRFKKKRKKPPVQTPVHQEDKSHEDDSADELPRYNRRSWGGWRDLDGNGSDSREEALIGASLVGVEVEERSRGEVIVGGLWHCPYTGLEETISEQVDIDHVVPVHHAHEHGAATWPQSKKYAFYNDPDNLIPVVHEINESKGSKGLAKWRPPRQDFWLPYATAWLKVKRRYELHIPGRELDAAEEMGVDLTSLEEEPTDSWRCLVNPDRCPQGGAALDTFIAAGESLDPRLQPLTPVRSLGSPLTSGRTAPLTLRLPDPFPAPDDQGPQP